MSCELWAANKRAAFQKSNIRSKSNIWVLYRGELRAACELQVRKNFKANICSKENFGELWSSLSCQLFDFLSQIFDFFAALLYNYIIINIWLSSLFDLELRSSFWVVLCRPPIIYIFDFIIYLTIGAWAATT